jgi:hypothetical protein
MKENPTIPKVSPNALAPLGPKGDRAAYGMYAAVDTPSIRAEAISQFLCVRSMRMIEKLLK